MSLKNPWSDDEVATLRALTDSGLTIQEMADVLKRSFDSVQHKQNKLGIGRFRNLKRAAGVPSRSVASDVALVNRAIDPDSQIPQWLDALRPVQLPAPKPPARRVESTNTTLVAGDFHFPAHCPRTVAVLLQVLEELRPQRLVLNGDTVDLLAVSRYPKDQRHSWDLRQEVTALHEFLHQVMQIGNAWGLEIVETEANHSGNGTASRWHRYLSDRVPVLYGHPKAEELLRYDNWFYPEWAPIRLADSVMIADDLLVLHGDIVRKHAAYSARGHAEKWHSSVMHSHTHRMGSSLERIPAVGSRPEMVRRAYEIGCMCNLNPSYVSAPNWTNGFAIVSTDAEDTVYGVELVSVVRGVAVVNAIGKTVRA